MTASSLSRALLRPSLGLWACAGCVLLSAGSAAAHDADNPDPREPRSTAPLYDPAEFRSGQYAALEFRAGPYRPNVDAEFDGAATPFEDLFGTGQSAFFGFELDWQALRIPHFGTLGPGAGWHFVSYGADSLSVENPGERVPHPTRMWLMPMYAVAVLRVDVLAREFKIPIVPYGKFGLSMVPWQTSDAGSTSVVDGVEGKGFETGVQFMLGGMLHLNWFAPQAALDMDNSSGVNHAYIFFEWMASKTDSFGSGMNVGTSTFATGVTVEF